MKLLSPKVEGYWTSVWQATPFTHHHESKFLHTSAYRLPYDRGH